MSSVLARRSAIVLALLFGLLFAVGTGLLWYLQQPVWLAVLFALVVVGAQFALGPWIIEHIFKIRWIEPTELGPEFAQWYRESCEKRRIPLPRLGVIDDGNPNAFTYGHTPKDARVVVTSGLVEVLTPAELHAVVAHELGHVANRDFIVMTVASAVPLVLYVLYVWTRRIDDRDSRGNLGPYAIAVAAGAYVAYVVSEYVVLLLSRVREYFADEAAAMTTRDPNALSSALVKISYGLARHGQQAALAAEADPKGKKGKRSTVFEPARAVKALGIANTGTAAGFAMSASDASGQFSPSVMAAAMQWDLQNPWAKWYELNSTHPLTARRIQAMNQVARRLGVETPFGLTPGDGAPRAYTGAWPLELLVTMLPYLGGIGGLVLGFVLVAASGSTWPIALPLIGIGAGWLGRILYSSPRGPGQPRTIESLVGEEINVSHVTPVRCVVEGEIIGRGVPGLFWSDDLVLRDGTGFLTLQYRQPLGFLELLFGWLKAGKFVGRPARVLGWYRRAPVPYIEIDRVEMLDGQGGGVRCWYVPCNTVLAGLLILAGVALALLG